MGLGQRWDCLQLADSCKGEGTLYGFFLCSFQVIIPGSGSAENHLIDADGSTADELALLFR